MDNKYMKNCSASLIIRKMQIKTITQYHLILSRMAIIKKKKKKAKKETKDNKSWQGWEKVFTLVH